MSAQAYLINLFCCLTVIRTLARSVTEGQTDCQFGHVNLVNFVSLFMSLQNQGQRYFTFLFVLKT